MSEYNSVVVNENEDERVALEILPYEKKVPVLSVAFELGDQEEENSSGAWINSLVKFCETDPLKENGCEIDLKNLDDGTKLGSFSVSHQNIVSVYDDDDVTHVDDADQLWTELSFSGRIRLVLVNYVGKFLALVALLYFFICSLDVLSSAFRILGGKTAGEVFANSELLNNPLVGLMIGILATVLVQSSSTSTSVIVTMVASGIIGVRPAIPIIMGANIGTSVTNTIVSMAQSGDRREFGRAFAGATVHDMFNWLTAMLLLPLEWSTGYLFYFTKYIIEACHLESYKGGEQELLTALTRPLTNLIVQVDKEVITKIAEGHRDFESKSLIQKYCVFEEKHVLTNITMETNETILMNGTSSYQLFNTSIEMNLTKTFGIGKCASLFSMLDIGDMAAGGILLAISLAILCTCLVMMVKLLNSMLRGSIAKVIKRTLNADFPGCWSWLTGYVAMLVGAVMTMLVQSSSVFTSALTPLVGIGMIKVERMYPLTLGSNIGTTTTGLLAAMATSGDQLPIALQIAMCHLFFNISGILLFYPVVPLRNLPIKCAKFLGTETSKYRWFAVVYIICMFFLLPAGVFLLSLSGFIPSICFAALVLPIVIFVIVLNLLQRNCLKCLPEILKTWNFLPIYLRSLQPIDIVISKITNALKKCCPYCQTFCKPKSVQSIITNKNRWKYLKPSPASSAASSATSSVLLLNHV